MAKGGKTFNDREKSAKVRNKVLDAILMVYEGKENELSQKQWELTLRIGTTVLPRLNEHTGEGGEKLFPEPLLAGKTKNNVCSNNSNKQTVKSQKKD